MKKLKVAGSVNEKGIFKADSATIFTASFAEYKNKRVNVWVEEYKKNRSTEQNAYLWGVVYPIISRAANTDSERVHYCMKTLFLKEPNEMLGMVTRKTSELNTVEFELYCKNVRAWASSQGLFIPLPNEKNSDRLDFSNI